MEPHRALLTQASAPKMVMTVTFTTATWPNNTTPVSEVTLSTQRTFASTPLPLESGLVRTLVRTLSAYRKSQFRSGTSCTSTRAWYIDNPPTLCTFPIVTRPPIHQWNAAVWKFFKTKWKKKKEKQETRNKKRSETKITEHRTPRIIHEVNYQPS